MGLRVRRGEDGEEKAQEGPGLVQAPQRRGLGPGCPLGVWRGLWGLVYPPLPVVPQTTRHSAPRMPLTPSLNPTRVSNPSGE